ncbi:hypothetical protein R2A130_0170 [Ahrensia sp. R2A130]|nr:hypothetical protein R2A130_0170 [Ahrensia sp. R2A130]
MMSATLSNVDTGSTSLSKLKWCGEHVSADVGGFLNASPK